MPVSTLVSARDCLLEDQILENIMEIPKQSYTSEKQIIPGLILDSKMPKLNCLYFLILQWYCMCVDVILLGV